jgi:hypothetical protein
MEGRDSGGALTAEIPTLQKSEAWVRQIHLDTVNQDHPLLKSGDQ